MIKNLFNNWIFNIFFGLVFTLLIGWISFATGETTNVWAFSIFTGAIVVAIKEVINTFMFESTNNWKNLGYGFIGNLIGGLVILCL